MVRLAAVLALGLPLLVAVACSTDGSDPTMDVGGGLYDDIPAKEILPFTPVEEKFCVGRQIDAQFSEYDYQCQAAIGKGKCVQMPNPHLGKPFYCALCGLKGTAMVCYIINPE
jgi:hypothetical protein